MSPLPFDFQPLALPIYLKYSNTILAHYKNAELHKMSKLAVNAILMTLSFRHHQKYQVIFGQIHNRDTLMARDFLRLPHPYDFF